MRSRFQFYRSAVWLVFALDDGRNVGPVAMRPSVYVSVCIYARCTNDLKIYDNMHLVKLLLLLLFSYLFLYDDDYVSLVRLFLMTCARTCNLSRLIYLQFISSKSSSLLCLSLLRFRFLTNLKLSGFRSLSWFPSLAFSATTWNALRIMTIVMSSDIVSPSIERVT